MYEDIHVAAKEHMTAIDADEFLKILSSPLKTKKAIINDWKRIDQLIFKSRGNKEQNQ